MAEDANVSVLVVCRSSFAKIRNLIGRSSYPLVIITTILLVCIAASNTTFQRASKESYDFERNNEKVRFVSKKITDKTKTNHDLKNQRIKSNIPDLERSDIDRQKDKIVSDNVMALNAQEVTASVMEENYTEFQPVDEGKKRGETYVAKTKAAYAKTKATNAKTNATNGYTKSTNANTKATNAKTKATNVNNKATKDKTKATIDSRAKRKERIQSRREKQATRRKAHDAELVKDQTPLIAETNADLTRRGLWKYEQLGRTDMLQADRKCKKRLPDAIIIGVMKAGTEAFSTFLAINPQVAMSLNVRSTLFFVSHYARGLSWYRNQMTCATRDQTTTEKAPQYFPSSFTPQRIFNMNRNIKLILMVRNPIDRAVSHYLQVKNSHPGRVKNMSFEDIVFTPNGHVVVNSGFIGLSRYSVILKRWLAYINRSQILIVYGDEFKTNQIKVLAETEKFLRIKHFITQDKFEYNEEKGFYCLKVEGSPACFGSGKGREHPPLSSANYHTLKAYFRPYNEEFYQMVGKRFNW